MSLPMSTETTPDKKGPHIHDAEAYNNDGPQKDVYQTSESRQQIGLLSAVFLYAASTIPVPILES